MLAERFNAMAETVGERMVAEQIARTEAQQLQQAEAHSRQRLERTVAAYLAFTHQVVSGDLTNRLDVQQDGALGQLGGGLNDMVISLHQMTSQVQQANQAITSAAAEILAATTQQATSAAEQSADRRGGAERAGNEQYPAGNHTGSDLNPPGGACNPGPSHFSSSSTT